MRGGGRRRGRVDGAAGSGALRVCEGGEVAEGGGRADDHVAVEFGDGEGRVRGGFCAGGLGGAGCCRGRDGGVGAAAA